MSVGRSRILVAATGVVALGALMAGCGGGTTATTSAPSTSSTSTSPSTAGTTHQGSPGQPKAGQNASASDFAPSLFGKKPTASANQFFPLKPGTQWVRQGFVNVGTRRLPHQVVTTVTDVSKQVDGARAVAVVDQDTNGGQIAEQSIDWVAEDKQGNVWYLGSYTESYEGGQFVSATDAWLAGLNGAQPGILMLADPQTGTPPYTEDTVPGIEAPTAQVVKAGQSQCVPFKCYHGVAVIQEGGEYKYYAPGVGQIKTAPQTGGGKQEVENLVNLRQLSPSGLSQISALTLKLDKHARVEAPSVFGNAPAAQRNL